MLRFGGDKWRVGGGIDTFCFEFALAKTSGRKGVGSFLPLSSSESLGLSFQNLNITFYHNTYIMD